MISTRSKVTGKTCAVKGLDVTFAQARDAHGHACPGLVMGYKAAIRAMKELKPAPDGRVTVTVFETCRCPVDAIKAVTGCSTEAGTLHVIDGDEAAFLFTSQATGESIRIALLPDFDLDRIDPEWAPLRKLVSAGAATDEEKSRFERVNDRVVGVMLRLPDDAIFSIGRAAGNDPV